MELKSISYYIKLYERKNLRQAASELYISPQGLSKVLQNLERELDTLLFERTQAGLIPTKAGDSFYRDALKLETMYHQTQLNIQTLGSQRKSLEFVCSYGVMNALPYERYEKFQKEHPEYEIRWREFPDHHAFKLLKEDKYAFGMIVASTDQKEDSFEKTFLFQKKPVLLVYEGHRLYENKSIAYADLNGESLIMEGNDFWINEEFRKKCLEHNVYPNINIETGDISFCHKLCGMKQGLGISVDFVAEFLQKPGLRMIPFEDEKFCWPVYLMKNKNRNLSEAGKEFYYFLQKEYKLKTKGEQLSTDC